MSEIILNTKLRKHMGIGDWDGVVWVIRWQYILEMEIFFEGVANFLGVD